MKKNQQTPVPESNNFNLPARPKSLRPSPSMNARKSLKPKIATVRPIKVINGPVVG